MQARRAAKSLQSCPTLCYPIDGSPPGSPVPGILQARTLEWVAIAFSNAWKWKVKVKSLSRVWLLDSVAYNPESSKMHTVSTEPYDFLWSSFLGALVNTLHRDHSVWTEDFGTLTHCKASYPIFEAAFFFLIFHMKSEE